MNVEVEKNLEFMGLLVRAMEAGHTVTREFNEVVNSLRVKMGLYVGKDSEKGYGGTFHKMVSENMPKNVGVITTPMERIINGVKFPLFYHYKDSPNELFCLIDVDGGYQELCLSDNKISSLFCWKSIEEFKNNRLLHMTIVDAEVSLKVLEKSN